MSQEERDRLVSRVLIIEGLANLIVLAAKTAVGLATGSFAILADAVHSLTDVANNVVAFMIMRVAVLPPDSDHPYGHRKFETLAVFGLAGLLTVISFELALHAFPSGQREITGSGWGLWTMIAVLVVNVGVASWERRKARELDSDILLADAQHTLGDCLTTVTVIVGWQLAARGHAWLDSLFALGVAGLVLYLAFGLFKRSVPILVDGVAVDTDVLTSAIAEVPGVHSVSRVRSRWAGPHPSLDAVIRVSPALSVTEGHEVSEAIEAVLAERFDIEDVTVHVEPLDV